MEELNSKKWLLPIPYTFVIDSMPEGYKNYVEGVTSLPVGDNHPGAFGYKRKFHIHEGVDFYCPEGTPVNTVESGIVVAIINFTGIHAIPSSPWWNDTQAILVEGESGVIVYGEISVKEDVKVGIKVNTGEIIGKVKQVLIKDKGRPMSMLHLEFHKHGTTDVYEWTEENGKPESLLDPTYHLLVGLGLTDELIKKYNLWLN